MELLGRGCEGEEVVSKIVLAAQIYSVRVELTLTGDKHGGRQTRGGNKVQVRITTSPQQPPLLHLSIYIQKPLDNLAASPSACLCVCEGQRGLADLTTTMLCSALAVVWVLAVLSPGLSLPAEDDSESGCSHCFYRQKPPQGASAGLLLQPLCHRLPGGHVFATQSKPTCDTAIYFAFHLSHGWTEREREEEGDLVVRMQL